MNWIYTRISTEQQSEASLENQELTCRKWVSEPVTVIQEIESGARSDRPKLNQMIDRLQTGDSVCVYDYSRLSRKSKDALSILDRITEKGAYLISGGKTIDPDDPIDMFTYSIHSAMAEMQRTIQSKKANEGIRKVYESGDYVFCSTLFGYELVRRGKTKTVNVIEEESKIVQFIFDKFSTGWSVKKLLSNLTGLSLQRQSNFTLKKISRILHQPIYMGYYIKDREKTQDLSRMTRNELEGLLIKSNIYIPLVKEEVWWTCFDRYREVRPTHSRPWQLRWTKHTLSGIIRCPDCGKGIAHFEKMGNVYTTEDHSVNCPSKCRTKYPGVWLESLMELTFYVTFSIGSEVGSFFSERQQELYQNKSEITEALLNVSNSYQTVQVKIDRLIDMVSDGLLTKEEVHRKIDLLRQEQKDIEIRKQSLEQDLRQVEIDVDSLIELSSEEVIETFCNNERDYFKKFVKCGYLYKDRIYIQYMNGRDYVIPKPFRHNHLIDNVTVRTTYQDDTFEFIFNLNGPVLVKSGTEVYDRYVEEILKKGWDLVNDNQDK